MLMQTASERTVDIIMISEPNINTVKFRLEVVY